MITHLIPADDPEALGRAAGILAKGGLVAFPTDTVYGVGVKAFNENAIRGLFAAKIRQKNKAIPILLGDVKEIKRVALPLSRITLRIIKHFWPGPVTLVIKKHPSLPALLSPDQTIGVRMPNHPVALALLRRTGPLAVTSANLSGEANTTTAQEVLQQLQGRIALILDGGQTPGGLPSTVVDCTGPTPVILRSGPISEEEIHAVIG